MWIHEEDDAASFVRIFAAHMGINVLLFFDEPMVSIALFLCTVCYYMGHEVITITKETCSTSYHVIVTGAVPIATIICNYFVDEIAKSITKKLNYIVMFAKLIFGILYFGV